MTLPTVAAYATGAIRPRNRTEWTLDPERAVLLVHDMQAHFVAPFERVPGAQIERAVDNIAALLRVARAARIPVVYTAQPPRQDQADRQLLTDFWGPGLVSDDAAAIIDELAPQDGDVVLTKWRYSAFKRTDLLDRLRNHGRDQLLITGVYSHIGCLTTALDAFMLGVQPFFVSDAQADFSAADHEMAERYVAARCGQVCASETVIEALGAGVSVTAGGATAADER